MTNIRYGLQLKTTIGNKILPHSKVAQAHPFSCRNNLHPFSSSGLKYSWLKHDFIVQWLHVVSWQGKDVSFWLWSLIRKHCHHKFKNTKIDWKKMFECSHFINTPYFFLIIVMLVLYIFSAEKGSLSNENTQISRVYRLFKASSRFRAIHNSWTVFYKVQSGIW